METLTFSPSNQDSLICNINPDVVIFGHWPAVMCGRKPSQVTVLDLAGPHILERHYQGSTSLSSSVLEKISKISIADVLISSGKRQERYFSSMLTRIGRSPENLFARIYMPMSPEAPKKSMNHSPNSPRFLFGGIFLPWQDPSWGLKALANRLEELNQGHLTLIGGPHTHYEVNSGPYYEDLFNSLEKNPKVNTMPLLPLEDFYSQISQHDLAISLMDWNLERHLAVPIRSCSFLWGGLPLICDDYSDIADLIRTYDAGWCCSPKDEKAFNSIIAEIMENPESLSKKSLNAKRLSSENFSWDVAVVPLLEKISFPLREASYLTDIIATEMDFSDLEVKKGILISQKFTSRKHNLFAIEIRLGNHECKSDLYLELHSNGECIASKIIPIDKGDSNQWIRLQLHKKQINSAGREYELKISGEIFQNPLLDSGLLVVRLGRLENS